jgi:hypothetical protein
MPYRMVANLWHARLSDFTRTHQPRRRVHVSNYGVINILDFKKSLGFPHISLQRKERVFVSKWPKQISLPNKYVIVVTLLRIKLKPLVLVQARKHRGMEVQLHLFSTSTLSDHLHDRAVLHLEREQTTHYVLS